MNMNDDTTIFLVIVGVAALIAGGIAWSFYAARKRREAMSALANELGLSFSPDNRSAHVRFAPFVSIFDNGRSRASRNVLEGDTEYGKTVIFEYTYVTGSGKHRTTHFHSVCIIQTKFMFKRLSIRKEGLFDKIAGMVGFKDIDFASAEFSKRFWVKSDDEGFAREIMTDHMIDFMLKQKETPDIELGGDMLAFHKHGLIKPAQYKELFAFATDFMLRMPQFGAGPKTNPM